MATIGAFGLVALSCGGSDGGDALSADQTAAFESAAGVQLGVGQALVLSDRFFNFDPTLDPTKSIADNIAAVVGQAKAALAGCGSITSSATTITVDFGTAEPCALTRADGKLSDATGAVSLAFSAVDRVLSVTVTFTDVVIDGVDLTGTATFATADGSTFDVTMDLTRMGNKTTADMTVVGAPKSATVDGTMSWVTDEPVLAGLKAGTAVSATLTGVSWALGDCYPNSGTMKLSQTLLSETIGFLSITPADGKANLTVGKLTTAIALPAYGDCPPPA